MGKSEYEAEQEHIEEQEIFSKVATHLLTQKRKSTDAGGTCKYRGPNDLKCAIGCLIGDNEYHPMMEGRNAFGLFAMPMTDEKGIIFLLGSHMSEYRDVKFDITKLSHRLHPYMDTLDALQRIHDTVLEKDWLQALSAYAEANRLVMPVL